MNKLDVVQFLITEIEEEKALFEVYNADIKQARLKADKANTYYWNYCNYKGKKPSKARIKDNCKKIRQILLDISKGEI